MPQNEEYPQVENIVQFVTLRLQQDKVEKTCTITFDLELSRFSQSRFWADGAGTQQLNNHTRNN